MSRQKNFLEGRILPSLLRFAIPVLLALCLQATYGAVDLLVVGQFAQATDMSAVSTGSQIMQTITMVLTSLAMGSTVLLARRIGEGLLEEAGRVIGAAVCLFSLLALGMTVGTIAVAGGFTSLMQAPAEAFDQTVTYVRICGGGSLFIVAYNLLGSIFRGMGDSKTPLIAVAIATVANIGGDLLLVGVFGMGAAGAAIATVAAQAISVLLCLRVIRARGLPFPFSRACIRWDGPILRDTLRLGAPIALQDALVSASFLAILAIVNALGLTASAAIGVAEKLCAFIMLVPGAFMQSLSAFCGQNMGAGKPLRAQKAMVLGMLSSFCVGCVMAWAVFFHGTALAGIFSSQTEVAAAAADYLRAYAIDTLLVSFLFCFIGYFNGCGKTAFVMVQGIVGAFAVRIPVSYLMSRLIPVSLFRVGLATPCSTVVQILFCAAYFVYLRRHTPPSDRLPDASPAASA